jgi:hypothetical protein
MAVNDYVITQLDVVKFDAMGHLPANSDDYRNTKFRLRAANGILFDLI